MTRTPAPSPDPVAADAQPVVATATAAATRSLPPVRRWQWAALVAILLLAVAVRVHGLTLNSLWIDELYSLEMSASQCYVDLHLPRDQVVEHPPHVTRLANAPPAWRIWTTLDDDQHPPLYFILLRLWRDAFGSSEAAMRSLSIVISVAGVALLFDVGRNTFGPTPALWACLIMALAHQQIWFAQQVRQYGLLTTLLLGACAAVARIDRGGFNARRGAALAACALGAMLTHYYAAAGCAAVAAYALACLRGRTLKATVAVLAAAAAVYVVVWAPFFVRQLHGVAFNNGWARDDAPGWVWRWAGCVLGVPMRLLSPPQANSVTASWFLAILLVLPWAFVRRRPAILLPLLYAVAIIAVPAGIDLGRRTFQLHHERYYFAAAPGIYLLAAGLLWDRRQAVLRHALPASVVLYCVLSLLHWVYIVHTPDWRDLGRYAAGRVRDGDVVAFYSPGNGDWYSGVAFLAVDHYATSASPAVLFLDGGPVAPEALSRLRSARAVWLFTDATGADLSCLLPGFTIAETHLAVAAGSFCRLRPPAGHAGGGS